MTDLYSAFAEDWDVQNATFDQLLKTAATQEWFLLIFKLTAKGKGFAAKLPPNPAAGSPSERFAV